MQAEPTSIRSEPLRWWVALGWGLLIGVLMLPGRAAPAPDAGLVGYYPFDGDLQDHSGFGRHALSDPVGALPRFSTTRRAFPNQVLGLEEGCAGITIPSLAGFGPNGHRGTTVSFWMHTPARGFLLGCARESDPGQSGFHLRIDDDRLWVSGGVGGEVGFAVPRNPGDWRHVVVVFDRPQPSNEIAMEVRLWIDGRSVGARPIEVNPSHLRTPLTVGGLSGTARGRLQGQIDSLRLYGKALSVEAIMSLHAHDTEGLGVTPILVRQPQAQSVEKGRDVTFAVSVQESAGCTFQWQLNQTNLPGAQQPELTLSNVPPALDGGRYRVLVQNASGAVFSESALLTVFPLMPPSIRSQPVPVAVAEGEPEVVFEVAATGSGGLLYQWQCNGKSLPSATRERLTLRHVRPHADGRYRVQVSNPYGSVWSDEVTLTVNTYDTDEDGLTDYEELLLKTDPSKPDYYGDRMPLSLPAAESDLWRQLQGASSASSQGWWSTGFAILQILLRMPHF